MKNNESIGNVSILETRCIILETYLTLASSGLAIPFYCTGSKDTGPEDDLLNVGVSVTRAAILTTRLVKNMIPDALRKDGIRDLASDLEAMKSVASQDDLQRVNETLRNHANDIAEKSSRETRVMLSAMSDVISNFYVVTTAFSRKNVIMLVLSLSCVARSSSLVASFANRESRQLFLDELCRAKPALFIEKEPAPKEADIISINRSS